VAQARGQFGSREERERPSSEAVTRGRVKTQHTRRMSSCLGEQYTVDS
jgi:hypothetical protein